MSEVMSAIDEVKKAVACLKTAADNVKALYYRVEEEHQPTPAELAYLREIVALQEATGVDLGGCFAREILVRFQ